MKLFGFLHRHKGPSDEATQARDEAHKISERAAVVYADRHQLLTDNHFAERIRLIYEGR